MAHAPAPAPAVAPAPEPEQEPELEPSTPPAPDVDPESDEPQWFYRDLEHKTQGPFRPSDMRQWLESGYFREDLPIRHIASPAGTFVALAKAFPDTQSAFVGLGVFAAAQQPPGATA